MFGLGYVMVALIVVLAFVVIPRIVRSASADERYVMQRDSPGQLSADAQEMERQRDRYSTANMTVDVIKLEMGRLRADVIWTIENSALWDISVPTSRAFFTALTVWDDHRSGWSIDERVRASAELKVLWKAAVDTATRLGIDHLSADDRPKAATAIKLVRKADSTTSEAERHQLMTKAADVLSGIMSITLPRETLRELEHKRKPPEIGDLYEGGQDPQS